eukprot:Hpha_TRINITY_DN12523_c0_g1::TRINITY_DN12523_c0_g1_i1::g.51188::m.51188
MPNPAHLGLRACCTEQNLRVFARVAHHGRHPARRAHNAPPRQESRGWSIPLLLTRHADRRVQLIELRVTLSAPDHSARTGDQTVGSTRLKVRLPVQTRSVNVGGGIAFGGENKTVSRNYPPAVHADNFTSADAPHCCLFPFSVHQPRRRLRVCFLVLCAPALVFVEVLGGPEGEDEYEGQHGCDRVKDLQPREEVKDHEEGEVYVGSTVELLPQVFRDEIPICVLRSAHMVASARHIRLSDFQDPWERVGLHSGPQVRRLSFKRSITPIIALVPHLRPAAPHLAHPRQEAVWGLCRSIKY